MNQHCQMRSQSHAALSSQTKPSEEAHQENQRRGSFFDFAQNLRAPTPPMTPRQAPLGSIRSPLSVMRQQQQQQLSPDFSPARSAFGSPFTSPLGHEPLFGANQHIDFLSSDNSHGLLGIISDSGTADELLSPMKQSAIRTPDQESLSSHQKVVNYLEENHSSSTTMPSLTEHVAEPPASISPPVFAFNSPQSGGLFRPAGDLTSDEHQPNVSFSDMPSGSYLFYNDDESVLNSSPLMRFSEPDAPLSYFNTVEHHQEISYHNHENSRPRRHSMLDTHGNVIPEHHMSTAAANAFIHPRRASFNEAAVRSPMFNNVYVFGRNASHGAHNGSYSPGNDPNDSIVSFGHPDTSFSTAYSSSVLLSEASSPLTTPSNRSRKRKPDEADDEPGHYPCTFPNCDKVFERIHNLRSHIRTHSGDRPYACTTCGLRFSRNHDLKRHERIHQGVRPYVCDFCGKSFLRLDALNRHLKVNNGKGCRTRVKKSELLNLPPVPVRMQSEVLIESDSLLTSAMQ